MNGPRVGSMKKQETTQDISKPQPTPSILGGVPDLLKATLLESIEAGNDKPLISSNSLANKFILARWSIRPTQRKRYKNLFASVRRHCRTLFRHYVHLKKIAWTQADTHYIFGVYKFDEIRGNVVLSFTKLEY
jgi:hypothetical protein